MILESLIDQLHGSEVDIPDWYTTKMDNLEELAELVPGPLDVLDYMRETIREHKVRYPEDWHIMRPCPEMSCPECFDDMKHIVPLVFQGEGVISFQCKECKIIVHKDTDDEVPSM
jgi:hypothetical protein